MTEYNATEDPNWDWLAEVQADFKKRRGAMTGADAVRQLEDQAADPIEARAMSRMRETERQREQSGRTSAAEALRWLNNHPPRNVSE